MATLHRETKQAFVFHHSETGWLFTGRTTRHGDFGPLEPFGQQPHWKTSPPSAPADGFLCGGQPYFHCTVEIRHSILSLPARILLQVELFFDVTLWNQRSGISSESAP
ncbi:hypothetical protein AVEN_179474-1 [Araneus ventricosus]|uniref:Uncharacterized protein n=1 Tax=Araneus ventricosus TaxID=182803 RepID=A0A4Y2BHF2_ARAVE|nr:hypothetical protein AVEN_179474-1 [Araneus ventricosus]